MDLAMERDDEVPTDQEDGDAEVLVLRTKHEIERAAAEWSELIRCQDWPVTPFQTPAWILSVIEQQYEERDNRQVRVVTVRDGHGLALVAPMSVSVSHGVRVLQWLGEPLSGYGDVVARAGCDVAALMRAGLASLWGDGDTIDVVHLRKVRSDAAVMPFLSDFTTVPLAENLAPYVELGAFPSFDAYLVARKGTALKGYRRKRRRLEDLGKVTFQVHQGGPRAQELGRQAIELKIRWMETYGKISRAFADPSCLEALMSAVGKRESGACVSELSIDGHPIALEVGLISKDRYYSFLGAMDLAYYKFSPGILQLLETLRWCFDHGIRIFDLLPSDSDYKRAWATDVASEDEWIRSYTLKGHLYENLMLKGMMPLSRRAYASVPLAFKKSTRGLVHRMLKG